jgi:hypothetical protein
MLDLIRGRKTFAMMIDCCWVVGRGGRLVVVVCEVCGPCVRCWFGVARHTTEEKAGNLELCYITGTLMNLYF